MIDSESHFWDENPFAQSFYRHRKRTQSLEFIQFSTAPDTFNILRFIFTSNKVSHRVLILG